MTIKESQLLKLLKNEVATYNDDMGYRSAVTVDNATLMGVIREFESMYSFIKAGNWHCKEDRVQYAIRGFIADQPGKLDEGKIYKRVLKMLLDELE